MKHQAVSIAVLIREKKILLSERPKDKSYHGFWEFPGGKRNENETSLAALKRECQEELGIIVDSAQFLFEHQYQYAEQSIHLDVYHIKSFQHEPQGCEGQKLAWHAYSKLKELNLLPANFAIVELISSCVPEIF